MLTLFLPGAGGSAAFWKPLADELDGEQLLMSWPGLGNEPHDASVQGFSDLIDLAQVHIDQPVNIIAQSMGGAIAVLLAAGHPSLVQSLTLFVTSAGVQMDNFQASDWRSEYRTAFPDAAKWIEDVRLDLSAQVLSLEIPTLLFWGDSDPISPVSVGRYLEQLFANAALHIIEGGDHDIGKTHAKEIAPIVDEHIKAALGFR